MGVNGIVDNGASQNMAVAGSNTAAILNQLDQKNFKDPSENRVRPGSEVKEMVQNGVSGSKAGMNVLSRLAAKLSTAGVNLKGERFSKSAREALEQMQGKGEGSSDMVDIQNALKRIQQRKQGQGQGRGEGRGEFDGETKGMMREYATLYAQASVNGSPEIKKKLKLLEQKLLKKGLTNKDLLSLKMMVKNSMQKEIADQLRDAFLQKVLSKEKSIEMVMSEKGLNDVLDFALLKGGHDNQSLQSTANDVSKQVAQELKDFTRSKLEQKLMQKLINTDKNVDAKIKEEMKQLLKLSGKVGLDLEEFIKNWQVKKFDLGLFLTDIPTKQNGAGTDTGSDNKDKTPYEYTKDDEKDLQMGRLRAIYMHRALAGDWKSMLETQFKMRKLKNGLIKLGVSSNELSNVEKEGSAAARYKLLEMIKDALKERATLYELAGPAFNLIEKKIKGLISNLERLGWKLSAIEFNALRDRANIKVFDAAKNEFLSLRDMAKGAKNSALEKRLKLVLKLMRRLKEESKLDVEIPEEEWTVKEAA